MSFIKYMMENTFDEKNTMTDLETIKKDVGEIKEALLGSQYQRNGLIKRVEDIEEWQRKMEVLKWKIYGGAVVVSVIGGVVVNVVLKYI